MKDTAYRTTGMRTRGLSMRALGVAWLASALACGSGNESGTARLEGYRSKLPHHTVQIDAQKAAEWEKRGAKVLGDYGAYKLVQVDDAMLDSLPSVQGAELRDDYAHILSMLILILVPLNFSQVSLFPSFFAWIYNFNYQLR